MTDSVQVIAALNDRDGKVLVVRRRDTWFFTQPGTMVEPGDEPLDALRAVLWDDLGIALPRTAFAPCACPPTWEPSNPARMTPTQGFAARAILTEITPAEHIAEAVWVNPADPHVGPLAPLTEDTILPRVVEAMGG